ncbi:MAG: nucleoside deaminase [Coriobacteriaceae bacterium]|nr:nucleoside deaminase [Coriobacteriaceae bacterium]
MPSHEDFMRHAIALSRARMGDGDGGPFGAVVVMDGEIVGEGWNRVTGDNDPTAHAEVVAIRAACERLGVFSLEGAVIYTTCEPCPMCLAAVYWARLDRVYYANTAEDAARIGFDDVRLHREVALAPAQRELPSERLLADEASAVLDEWAADPDRLRY